MLTGFTLQLFVNSPYSTRTCTYGLQHTSIDLGKALIRDGRQFIAHQQQKVIKEHLKDSAGWCSEDNAVRALHGDRPWGSGGHTGQLSGQVSAVMCRQHGHLHLNWRLLHWAIGQQRPASAVRPLMSSCNYARLSAQNHQTRFKKILSSLEQVILLLHSWMLCTIEPHIG